MIDSMSLIEITHPPIQMYYLPKSITWWQDLYLLDQYSFTKLTAVFIMLENYWILIILYMEEKFKCLDKKRKAEE